jgi:hypothetical protein
MRQLSEKTDRLKGSDPFFNRLLKVGLRTEGTKRGESERGIAETDAAG